VSPPPVALTIAGSDSSGGAGIAADLRTFAAFGVHGAAALTAVTAQNTTGVRAVEAVSPALVRAQIAAVLEDLEPGALKTGMLHSAPVVEAVGQALAGVTAPLVIDPVMVATSGARLLEPDAVEALQALMARARLVTPNLAEAAILAGRPVASLEDLQEAARRIARLGPRAVLVKGGHASGDPVDVLLEGGAFHVLRGTRVPGRNTHGTGCTLSAAITALLARGVPLLDAARRAKEYVERSIARAPGLGRGAGPLGHFPSGLDGA